MSNQQTPDSGSTSKAVPIALGVLVALVAVFVAVVLLAGGSEDEVSVSAAEAAHIPTTGEVAQVAPAQGIGQALDPLDPSTADPAVGEPAPDITASYFDNTEVSIDMSDGTPRLVMFFAHWCPHCQDEVAELTDRFAVDGVPEGIELVAVSTAVDDGSPNYPPSQWFLDEEWPAPVLRDSAANDLATAFGLGGFPYTVAINGEGTVVGRVGGNVPEAQFNQLIELAKG